MTTYGSAVFADHVPSATAECVRRLEAAGYSNVGKTNLHEFAYGVTSMNPHFGWVPNPVAPGRIAGGSSGGSAAALAAGLADAALGSDTGGSIRIPAAFCGVVGFKPTFGLVSLEGCWPLAPSYDHAGPMARDVATCTAMLEVLADDFVPATTELAAGERARAELREEAEQLLDGFDLLLTPTQGMVAPRYEEAMEDAMRVGITRFTNPFNALGWPALALPCGAAEHGLPASIQLVGRAGEDALVLAAGVSLERVTRTRDG